MLVAVEVPVVWDQLITHQELATAAMLWHTAPVAAAYTMQVVAVAEQDYPAPR
jgi:hypothetical protein